MGMAAILAMQLSHFSYFKELSFVDPFVIYVSCLSCFLVCSLQPCGHLLGKDWPFGSLCVVFSCVLSLSDVVS